VAALFPPRVFPYCRFSLFGDSRTFLNPFGVNGEVGRLKDLIEATWRVPAHASYGRPGVTTGNKAIPQGGSIPSVQPASYPTVTMFNFGVSGSRIADLDANINAYLDSAATDIGICWHNTNDANGIVGPPTDPTVFSNTYQSVVNKWKVRRPNKPFVIVSDLVYGENYLTSPDRINSFAPISANVPSLWSLNPQCKAVSDANTDVCTYADICTPYLAWLIANFAPPGPSTGAATTDGLHENVTPGMGLISTWVKSALVIDP